MARRSTAGRLETGRSSNLPASCITDHHSKTKNPLPEFLAIPLEISRATPLAGNRTELAGRLPVVKGVKGLGDRFQEAFAAVRFRNPTERPCGPQLLPLSVGLRWRSRTRHNSKVGMNVALLHQCHYPRGQITSTISRSGFFDAAPNCGAAGGAVYFYRVHSCEGDNKFGGPRPFVPAR
jgi:hypothetical protein